jgi:alpha-glucosidase
VTWWRDAVVYQIYPRSFRDSNGDGIGDLNGIRQQLDYLASLGVDALWLSPIYPSPMRDFGYDVANYVSVDPVFGTLEDFDELVREAHDLGLRIVLDWVPNHTSSDHPWFVDSRASRASDHRDWYLWRDAQADGSPPNNWVRAWSDEPTWTWDGATEQYYLHCFLESQPDLNWENVEVRRAMHETLRFWLGRGVDGFRMDVVHLLGKNPAVDDLQELRALSHVPLNDVPVTHEYLREIRAVLDEYEGDRVSIGEVFLLDPHRVANYYGEDDELHLSFNFAPLYIAWRADAWATVMETTYSSLEARDAWPTWVLSNHDNARIATRLGGDPRRTRAALVLLLTLRGTPFLFAGEELGLEDAVIPPDRVVDPGGRDGCRAPMPWTMTSDYGWPTEPWLPFVENAAAFSVEAQRGDADSMLHFTQRLLALRHSNVALRRGEIVDVRCDDDVLTFDRVLGDQRLRVLVNFAGSGRAATLARGELLVSNCPRGAHGALQANEAAVYDVTPKGEQVGQPGTTSPDQSALPAEP